MARLCMPGNRVESLIRRSDGQYDLQGITTNFQRTFIRIHDLVTNSTDFQIRLSAFECVQALKNDESDIVVALMPLEDVEYYVPIAGRIATVNFMAGNNDSKHQQKISDATSKLGLLSNIRNFTLSTWCTIMIFTLLFISLVYFRSLNYQILRSLHVSKRHKSLWDLFSFSMKHLMNAKFTRFKWLCFLIFLLYFLLATPFLLMFKTNQLVVATPYIVNSYERAIESNVTVFVPSVSTNESRFLQPNSKNLHNDDTVNRFWKFFQQNSHPFDTSVIMKGGLALYIDQLVSSRCIFMSGLITISLFKSIFCAFSVNDGMRINLFMQEDANQREEVQGLPFRTGYVNPKVVKLHRRLNEMETFARITESLIENTGRDLLSDTGFDASVRFDECFRPKSLDSRAKKEVAPGSISLFTPLLYLLLVSYLVCGGLVIAEKIVHRLGKMPKPRRRERRNRRYGEHMFHYRGEP